MLDVAILPELTPALCRAVTRRDDAGQLLDRAFRRNLFLMITGGPTSDTGKAYRFHDLFAVFLRGRLAEESPDRVRELHRRAADAATDASQAIAHYCAAEVWEQAARAITANAGQFTRHGMFGRLRDWIKALPTVVQDARPELLRLLGIHAFITGRWEEARDLLERAQPGLVATGDRTAAQEALLMLTNIAVRTGNGWHSAALAARAQEIGPLPIRFRIFLSIGHAWDSMRNGNFAEVERATADSVNLLLGSDDPADWNIISLAPPLALGPNGTATIEAYCDGALNRFGDGISLVLVNALQVRGYLHLIRGRLDEAAETIERAAALNEQLGEIGDVVPGIIETRCGLAIIRNTPGEAGRIAAERLAQVGQDAMQRGWRPGYRYLVAKSRWLAVQLTEARAVTDRLGDDGPFPDFPMVPQAQALLYGMIETSEGRYAEAECHFREAASHFPPYFGITFWLDHAQVLLAHCYERWGRPHEALETLRPVLEECERLDTPGIIAKVGPAISPVLRLAAERQVHAPFAARLLAILGSPVGVTTQDSTVGILVPETGETLSPREVEVLRLLATGASNTAIAATLFISQNTVKTHVARILARLGVESRTQAAARARDLELS